MATACDTVSRGGRSGPDDEADRYDEQEDEAVDLKDDEDSRVETDVRERVDSEVAGSVDGARVSSPSKQGLLNPIPSSSIKAIASAE